MDQRDNEVFRTMARSVHRRRESRDNGSAVYWPRALQRLALPAVLLAPSSAAAHSRETAGFISGVVHPFLGIDHLLAMISVGVVSARIGGGYIWRVPSLFVLFMVLGGVLGARGARFPMAEWGIALSVLVLGLVIVFVHRASRGTIAVMMTFVAFFGSLHGHAHGAEMPTSVSPAFYSAGFVASTGIIHLLGVYIGSLPRNRERLATLPLYVGCAVAIAGFRILYGLAEDWDW